MSAAPEPDLRPWPGLALGGRVGGGHRSLVWRGTMNGEPVSIRRNRRSSASFEWELDLMSELADAGFTVPEVVRTADDRRHHLGLVVQRWLPGRPPETDRERRAVAAELARLHSFTNDHRQRPGCCTSPELAEHRRSVDADLDALPQPAQRAVLAEFASVADAPRAVIHGDPHPGNVRIGADGSVALLDWDESRVDVTWHDLSELGVDVLDRSDHLRARRLSHAWEAVNAWVAEPDYARRRYRALLDSPPV